MTSDQRSGLSQVSDTLADAVEAAGAYVVAVNARRRAPATGIHWRAGTVVTADHVVEREEGITLQAPGGEKIQATLAGRDPTTDIAVLTCDKNSLPGPPEHPASTPRPGQLVVAVGRPGDAGLSVSFGAVSSVGSEWRTWAGGRIDQLIRPDVTFYPGFSGGPLIDVSGGLLGMNTSGLSRGLPLSIPVVTVARVVDQLAKGGRIARGYLGVRMQSVDLPDAVKAQLELDDKRALLVVGVEPKGPAEQAGLFVGDILVSIEGRPVSESDAVQAILDPETVGKSVTLRIVRGGEEKRVAVTVAARPEDTHGPGHPHVHGGGRHRG
jgi:S1-C subfamily serine protease